MEKVIKIKKDLHDVRMELSDNEGFEINREDFESVLNKFSSKSTNRGSEV